MSTDSSFAPNANKSCSDAIYRAAEEEVQHESQQRRGEEQFQQINEVVTAVVCIEDRRNHEWRAQVLPTTVEKPQAIAGARKGSP